VELSLKTKKIGEKKAMFNIILFLEIFHWYLIHLDREEYQLILAKKKESSKQ
jgi:hypothetical protein